MISRMRRSVWIMPFIVLPVALILFFFVIPYAVSTFMNGARESPPYRVSDAISALHDRLTIVDLHADTLLWGRDPNLRARTGHVDLPRLRSAGVKLQIFSAVTKTPRGLNFEHNAPDSDNITPLVIAQRWPVRTWNNLTERALYQAHRLQQLEAESGGKFIIIKNRAGLASLLSEHGGRVGGLLAIEGMHALSGDPKNLAQLYAVGYRMMGLTHFFDNALGGSAHGETKGGLTPLGRALVSEMERNGILVDLAHASPALIDDVLAIATRPVVVSHTGVKGTCDRTRNLSDAHLRAIAANGGLVGIAYFEEAVCGTDADAIARAIRYAGDLVGFNHVALGSDFDGAVTTPFDVTGLPLLWRALLQAGLTEADIAAVAGGNAIRLLERTLPDDITRASRTVSTESRSASRP